MAGPVIWLILWIKEFSVGTGGWSLRRKKEGKYSAFFSETGLKIGNLKNSHTHTHTHQFI